MCQYHCARYSDASRQLMILSFNDLTHCLQHLLDIRQLGWVFAEIAVADCPAVVNNEYGTDDCPLIAASIDARVQDTIGRGDLSGEVTQQWEGYLKLLLERLVSEDRIEADGQQLGTQLAETVVCVSKLRQFMSSDRSEIEAIEYQHHRTLTQGSRERKLISSSRLESEVWRGIVNLQRRHSLLLVPRSQLSNM